MPAEKSSVSKSSENRRSNKPLMEKRRRARINHSLTELKSLILDAVKKDSSRHNKLEKADILEMTVKYLQNLQRQQLAANIVADPNVANKFRAGFGECANEVTRFLEKSDTVETNVRSRLLGHLTTCLTGLEKNSSASSTSSSVSTEPSPSTSPCPNSTEVPSSPSSGTSPTPSVDLNNNNTKTNNVPSLDTVFSGLQLIPTRLANGEIAFILPTHHALAAAQALSLGRLEQLTVSPRSAPSSPTLVAQVSPMSRTEECSKTLKAEKEVVVEEEEEEEEVVEKDIETDGEKSQDSVKLESDSDKISRPEPKAERSNSPSLDKDIGSLDDPVWRPW